MENTAELQHKSEPQNLEHVGALAWELQSFAGQRPETFLD
jgi:hypothetical protein